MPTALLGSQVELKAYTIVGRSPGRTSDEDEPSSVVPRSADQESPRSRSGASAAGLATTSAPTAVTAACPTMPSNSPPKTKRVRRVHSALHS